MLPQRYLMANNVALSTLHFGEWNGVVANIRIGDVFCFSPPVWHLESLLFPALEWAAQRGVPIPGSMNGELRDMV